jgi:hypothetical protein
MASTISLYDPSQLLMSGGAVVLLETRQGRPAGQADSAMMMKAVSDVAAVGGLGLLCFGPGCHSTVGSSDDTIDPSCSIPVAVFRPAVGVLLSTMLRRIGPQGGGRTRVHRPEEEVPATASSAGHPFTVVTLREMVGNVLGMRTSPSSSSSSSSVSSSSSENEGMHPRANMGERDKATDSAPIKVSYTTLEFDHPLALGVRPPRLALLALRDPGHASRAIDLIAGPAASGMPLHVHEHQVVWHWLVSGEKRWLLVGPGVVRRALQHVEADSLEGHGHTSNHSCGNNNPNRSFASRFHHVVACLRRLYPWHVAEVTQTPGDALIVPPGWGHAVLNTAPSVGMSAQLGELPSRVVADALSTDI